MVGNDLVDLADPEALSPHPRFDARVFTIAERAAIATARDPHRARWMRWAAKESAFKLARREEPTTVFAHARFATSFASEHEGWVRVGAQLWRVTVCHAASTVHAVATCSARDQEQVVVDLRPLAAGADPRAAVRALAVDRLARHLGSEPRDVAVATGPDRIPELVVAGRRRGSLSLSHHGAFVAVAWLASRSR